MTDTRLDRFIRAAKLLGGCFISKEGEITDRPGWLTYAAESYGTDKSNFAKILSGQRTLTPALEGKMLTAIRTWRHAEIRRHKALIMLQTDFDIDLKKGGILIDEPDSDDGPTPGFGG